MIKRSMLKEYLRYILLTMLTFTLASVYSIVDGVFVGHAVGDAGVAGINVARERNRHPWKQGFPR